MIALVLAMAWSRRGQALTLALLALFAVAAAVAAPAYLRAADRGIAAGQVAVAGADERSLVLSQNVPDRRGQDTTEAVQDVSLNQIGTSLTGLPGFTYVYAAEYPSIGLDPDTRYRTQFVYRQGLCAHLAMATGRCLIGEGDVVIGDRTARRLRLRAGEQVTLAFAFFNTDERMWQAAGTPKRFLIAGTYRVSRPDEPYWGAHGYFSVAADRPDEPAFVTAASLAAMDHGAMQVTIDGVAGPAALAVDRLPAFPSQLAALQDRATAMNAGVRLETRIPDLLARIDAGRRAAHRIVPVLAVALVVLACMSIYLAVSYSISGRRPELAVVALRGTRRLQNWWLAIGENLVAILAGAAVGCLAGQLLVNFVAAVRFPDVGADPGWASLRYAPAAALAAMVTAAVAQRRQLGGVTELLRRVPARTPEWVAVAGTAVVTVLAAVAAVQLRSTGGTLAGVGTFAVALIVVALAQLAARAVLPAVAAGARRALQRGRLGAALAGYRLSRRAGAARLFGLLTAAVAITAYAVAAVDVATQQRDLQSTVGFGAARVLAVGPIGPQQLMSGVRAVDPRGSYALAAVRLRGEPGRAAGLAADTTRLAAVAYWPGGGPGPAAVARSLRPVTPAPVTVTGLTVTLDVTATGLSRNRPVSLAMVLSSVTGLGDAVVPLGDVRAGRHAYARSVPVCRQGCRLNALRLFEGDGVLDVTGRLTLHSLVGSGAALPLGTRTWRSTAGGHLASTPDGVRIDITSLNGLPDGMIVQPADTPYPLPAVTAGPAGASAVTGLDGRPVSIQPGLRIPAVPGVGAPGVLVDLDYADRLAIETTPTGAGQVWLSSAAPADVVSRLRAQGLDIVDDVPAAQVRQQVDAQGPALALWFYALAAGLATALAAGVLLLAATVDRARHAEDLSALRHQGLPTDALRQATLWTYPALAAVATIAGIGIGLAGWGLTGWALPLAGLQPPPLPLPGWPRAAVMAALGVAMVALLAAVAYLAGRRTLRSIP